MVSPNRRRGFVPVIALNLCMAVTGCLNTAHEQPMLQPSSSGYLSTPRSPNATIAPPLNPGMAPGGSNSGVTPASYTAPARFTGQVMPGNPDDVNAPQPGPGMPAQVALAFPPTAPMPRELAMTAHPPHRVAPLDILYLEALRLVPKGPYRLEPMEVLQIEITGAFKDQIKGLYMISPEGTINLGHTLDFRDACRTLDPKTAIADFVERYFEGVRLAR